MPEIPFNVKSEIKTPNMTMITKTPICVQESPDMEPNVQIKNALIFSEGAKNCKTPMIAEASPATIIPTMINPAVELNLDEKKTMILNPNMAPQKDAKHKSQGLFSIEVNPRTDERKIIIATPSPEADVIPKTDGSANGFLNNSCNKSPLTGKAIPAKIAAMVLGNR